jgi:hypothetical protein
LTANGKLDLRALPEPVAPAGPVLTRAAAASASLLGQRLVSLVPEEREGALLELVRTETAIVLGLTSHDALEPHRPLRELGLHSLMAVELRNRLATATGLRLHVTLLFDHPTVSALVQRLATLIAPQPSTTAHMTDIEIRGTLASIPLDHLRSAGLLDTLIRLANDPHSFAELRPLGGAPDAANNMDDASDEELFARANNLMARVGNDPR